MPCNVGPGQRPRLCRSATHVCEPPSGPNVSPLTLPAPVPPTMSPRVTASFTFSREGTTMTINHSGAAQDMGDALFLVRACTVRPAPYGATVVHVRVDDGYRVSGIGSEVWVHGPADALPTVQAALETFRCTSPAMERACEAYVPAAYDRATPLTVMDDTGKPLALDRALHLKFARPAGEVLDALGPSYASMAYFPEPVSLATREGDALYVLYRRADGEVYYGARLA